MNALEILDEAGFVSLPPYGFIQSHNPGHICDAQWVAAYAAKVLTINTCWPDGQEVVESMRWKLEAHLHQLNAEQAHEEQARERDFVAEVVHIATNGSVDECAEALGWDYEGLDGIHEELTIMRSRVQAAALSR